MVRVGSLTDLELIKKAIIDSKSGMTPSEQLDAVAPLVVLDMRFLSCLCHEKRPPLLRRYCSMLVSIPRTELLVIGPAGCLRNITTRE